MTDFVEDLLYALAVFAIMAAAHQAIFYLGS